MDFTKEQLSEVLCKHAERENGLQDLMEIMLERMMVAERREYLREDSHPGDKWGRYYRAVKRRRDDSTYKMYFTYLNYDHRIQSMKHYRNRT